MDRGLLTMTPHRLRTTLLIETRSLSTLTHRYRRNFTFNVADSIRSIRKQAGSGGLAARIAAKTHAVRLTQPPLQRAGLPALVLRHLRSAPIARGLRAG
jgi:hypothetical protein